MPDDTSLDPARRRVRTEQSAVDGRISAFERFLDRVSDVPAEGTGTPTGSVAAGVGTQTRISRGTDDGCRRVRRTFAETIRPRSVEDTAGTEPLMETIRAEFTDEIAVALSPTTHTSLTGELKAAVVAEAEAGLAEADAVRSALRRESRFLAAAAETVEDVSAWLTEADETPLSALGFDALRDRHRTLTRVRATCDRLLAHRQRFVGETTSAGGEASIRHRRLVDYLYQDCATDYPVLSVVARLAGTCDDCRRAVRDHLVRRV